jgi:hypothetical protein
VLDQRGRHVQVDRSVAPHVRSDLSFALRHVAGANHHSRRQSTQPQLCERCLHGVCAMWMVRRRAVQQTRGTEAIDH